ncbi:carbohydrate ABC transporter permease [Dictyobacter kobayashii]|uniref:Sugar ABC transporter permease n=1 Tax=Dictyobacter kobayashii TaxID=2014872 RepID=A0A402ASU2_9CHLR|nr:sugar ABC transporter permease [Dictyobacter kobayashii]GCE22174.1 sugar ABC transporter permease [Dictyobacter kobayashii]
MPSSSTEVQAAEAAAPAASLSPKLRRRSRIETWLFILVALIFQLAWGWYPLIAGLAISFTDGQVIQPSQYVGFANYVHIFSDPLVGSAFYVTFIYSIMSIALTFFLPIIASIFLLEMPKKVTYWMMFLWFLPLSNITTIMLWRYFYDRDYGIFQFITTSILHLPPQLFLEDPKLVLFWLVLPGALFFSPGLLYLASLQSIPTSYYEAAEVEGASFWRKIWTISLPRIRPVIALMLLLSIITSLQTFDSPKILTEGGPSGSSRTVMIYVYDLLSGLRYADASALACLLFLVTLVFIIISRLLVKEDPDA